MPDGADETLVEALQETPELTRAREILDEYWLRTSDLDKVWDTLMCKEREYYDALARRGFFALWRLIYTQYYGVTDTGLEGSGTWQSQTVSFAGENGEHVDLTINEFRSFADQIVAIITKMRPTFQALARNTDYKSLAMIEASDTLVKHYLEQTYTERRERSVVLAFVLFAKAFATLDWDEEAGPMVEVDDVVQTPAGPAQTTRSQHAGEFNVSVRYAWEVFNEPYLSEDKKHVWRAYVDPYRTKADLIARYPEKAIEIDGSGYKPPECMWQWPGSDALAKQPEDVAALRVLYAARTAAVPNGRKVVFVNDVCVWDSELDVDEIPVYPLFTGELLGTCFGVPHIANMIPLEQIKNQILSDMATNVEAFGRPPLIMPEGTDYDLDELANGQKVVRKPAGADDPTVMRYPEMPQQSFKLLDAVRSLEQSISGLNAIARGETTGHVTSGSYAALYTQQAVESQSDLQMNVTLLRERLANGIIDHLKRYATAPQLVEIVGKDARPYLQYFTKDQWSSIQRVRVEQVNPALATTAGKLQIVEALKNFPGLPLKNPEQIVELIVSGTWKPLLSTTRVSDMRIRYENEKLLEGGTPIEREEDGTDDTPDIPVYPTDDHTAHIFGHLEVLNSPLAAQNENVRSYVMAHIVRHVIDSRTADPYLAQLLGHAPPEQGMGQQQGGPNNDVAGGAPSDKTQSDTMKTLGGPDDSMSQLPQAPEPSKPPAGMGTDNNE